MNPFMKYHLIIFFVVLIPLATIGQELSKEERLVKAIKERNYKEATRLIKEERAASYYTDFVSVHEKPNYEKMPKMGKSKNIARAFAIMVVSPVIALKNISKGRGRTKKVGYNMLDYTLLYSQRVTPEMLKFVKLLKTW